MTQETLPEPRASRYAVVTAMGVAFLLYIIHYLDEWEGILAFRSKYIVFSLIFASAFASAWLLASRRKAVTVGLTVFALLMSLYVVTTPSARILRKVLIDFQPGTRGEEVKELIEQAYSGSCYDSPTFVHSPDSIYVSLYDHYPGHWTLAVFHLKDGLVVRTEFLAD